MLCMLRFFKIIATLGGVLFILLLAGMYLFFGRKAGTWQDDPRNWARAFNGAEKSAAIQVHRSYYTRSPHFTYEATYGFALSMPEPMLQELIRFNHLTRSETLTRELQPSASLPDWFLPGPENRYIVWFAPNSSYGFKIYQNRETSHIYIYDAS